MKWRSGELLVLLLFLAVLASALGVSSHRHIRQESYAHMGVLECSHVVGPISTHESVVAQRLVGSDYNFLGREKGERGEGREERGERRGERGEGREERGERKGERERREEKGERGERRRERRREERGERRGERERGERRGRGERRRTEGEEERDTSVRIVV